MSTSALWDPILVSLQKDADKNELTAVINKHLEEHIGLEAKHYRIEEFADKVLNWWKLL